MKKFIDKCRPGCYYGDVNISKDIVDKWDIFLTENETVIAKILILRDKVYAHRDRNHKDVLKANEIYFTEIEPLIVFTENVIREVYLKFGSDVYFKVQLYFDKERYSVITDLVEYMPIKERAIFNRLTGRPDGES